MSSLLVRFLERNHDLVDVRLVGVKVVMPAVSRSLSFYENVFLDDCRELLFIDIPSQRMLVGPEEFALSFITDLWTTFVNDFNASKCQAMRL
ncbi:hypothetical protein [Halococcus salsus]|uniref:hypothetical protein n=1 Tax=Halococcus salsus TaxID=2162894 RepID=UPI00135749EC|nr:hypothetical protein [Halococcus salsus]